MPNSYQGQPNTRRFGLSFHFTSFFISIHSGRILRSTPGSQVWAYVPASGLHGSSARADETPRVFRHVRCDVAARSAHRRNTKSKLSQHAQSPSTNITAVTAGNVVMVGGGCQRAPTTGLQRKRKVSRKEKQKWAGRGLCPRSEGPQNRHAGSVGQSKPISRLSRTMADSCADSETSNTLRRAYSTWAGRPALPLV
jgi:hypothetical protein